jgi:hypothetical protein
MTNIMSVPAKQSLILGTKVEKSSGATAAATTSLFTVTGLVYLTALIGYVTVAFDGTTTSININHDPTIGSAVNLDAPTVVTSDVVGTIYSRLTTRTGLIVSEGTTAPTSAYTVLSASNGLVLTPGVVGSVGTAADAGTVLWRLFYLPISDDGAVVAA